MFRTVRGGLSYANVIATLALFLALGGGAYAALRIPNNSVGTKQLKSRAVTLSKISNTARSALHGQKGTQGAKGDACLSSDPNCKGPKGDACLSSDPNCKGPKGDACLSSDPNCKGPQGDPGPGIRWALIKGSDGSVIEQSGGITGVRQGTGSYYVDFGSAVTGHPISALIHSAPGNVATVTGAIPCSGGLLAGTDSIVCAEHNTVGEVAVGTANIGTGSPSDQDFYIEVFN